MIAAIKMGFLFLILTFSFAPQAKPITLEVIVHKANPISSLSIEAIRNIFIKRTKSWSELSEPMMPIDRAQGSPERELFLTGVLKQTASEMEKHWIRQKQVTGDVAPQYVGSDRLVVMMVKSLKGSIGYIRAGSLSERERSQVKVILEIKNVE